MLSYAILQGLIFIVINVCICFCSGGASRTAVFIALDILSNQLAQENQINVLEAVYKMRLCRTDMVQSLVRHRSNITCS